MSETSSSPDISLSKKGFLHIVKNATNPQHLQVAKVREFPSIHAVFKVSKFENGIVDGIDRQAIVQSIQGLLLHGIVEGYGKFISISES